MRKLFTFSIFAALILFSTSLFAQSSPGKLAGKVTDATTGEALIGANVILINTSMGSAADVNGDYFILNITPGTYDIKFSYVGFSTKTVKNIRIVPGVTYELNVSLSSGIDLDEIVVTSQKLYEEKATNTVKVIDSEDIARLPVRGVENLASLQAGVVKSDGDGGAGGNAEINVRGGRGTEVVYIIDGVIQNNPLYGTNQAQISNSSIDQISFQVGGYEAKFGQAQSGIINVTTKSGSPKYSVYGEVITSSFTDDYGYNLYTGAIGGPIVPGNKDHTFFASAERGWFLDGDPAAIPVEFKSIDKYSTYKPDNTDAVWRFNARTNHNLGNGFNLQLGTNLNTRKGRFFDWDYAKNNSEHNPRQNREVYSFSSKLSQNIGTSSFWNVTLGYNTNRFEEGDGVYFDNVEAYGDTAFNPAFAGQGNQGNLLVDDESIFIAEGYVDDYYRKYKTDSFSGNLNFTTQIGEHLIEAGGGASYSIMRFISMRPVALAKNNLPFVTPTGDTVAAKSLEQRYEDIRPYRYGYDVQGNEIGTGDSLGANTPLLAHLYVQDRFELEDLVLNLGVRVDYFDSKAQIIGDTKNPYSGGTNPTEFDPGDFSTKDAEFHISPRIGLGFPVTESTVFHAQYGKFIQEPRLIDLYPFQRGLDLLQQTSDFRLVNGHIESEVTTQYEIGFRQILGDNAAAINLTAFYKNTEGLTNRQVIKYNREVGGEELQYFATANSDFGTVKGLAITLNVPRLSYFSLSFDYTYSISEGTGSSTNASYVAAFRNTDGEIPKVIAPLDYDQRHTGVAILDFFVPKGELGFLEMTGINALISFASGRPYTPLETQNLTVDYTNYGTTKGYVNSATGPGTFRMDLKIEKTIGLGDYISLTPYLQIENVFDAANSVDVWRSTGSPYTTNFLDTEEAKKLAVLNGDKWVDDYKSIERDPTNFGIPRLIKLGFKVNFAGL